MVGNQQIVGYINFYSDEHVPESKAELLGSVPTQMVMLRFPIGRIEEILATLRQEKPVHIGVDSGQKIGWVGTGAEPVGEQEGV